jgi:primosomal protein N' (replication factor Y)
LSSIVAVADVAVAGARPGSDGVLSYGVPAPLSDTIRQGQLVWVPLRAKPALGLITRLHEDRPTFDLKPVIKPVEPLFRISAQQLEFASWLARETACGLYDTLSLFFPPGISHQSRPYLRLRQPQTIPAPLTAMQRKLVDLLTDRGEMSVEAARSAVGSRLTSVIPALETAGVVEQYYQVGDRAPSLRRERWIRLSGNANGSDIVGAPMQEMIVSTLRQRDRLALDEEDRFVPASQLLAQTGAAKSSLDSLLRKGVIEAIERPSPTVSGRQSIRPDTVPELSAAQSLAWSKIETSLQARNGETFLLYGVTGSGKTEIYLRAAAWCLRHGRSALMLVPEIALSSQVAGRFTARFGGRVAILHSGLSDADRYAAWQGIAAGELPIVVGARSALFAPVPNLGLVVLDEEHDPAYKQDSAPRYHARSAAEHLAGMTGATLVLGSATPAVESFWRAQQGEVHLILLPQRVGPGLLARDGLRESTSLELPRVDIVDMRLELHRGNTSLLSLDLQELVDATLRRREQAILLLNRRGLATVVLCRSCGLTLSCPYCDIPLVYHQDRERLLCHRCDYREARRDGCPACGGPLDYFGAGTQRVEAETRRLFPGSRVLRWDQDAVRSSGGPDALLHQVERGETDIIIGTQMVAKGFDLPGVTAIGVINADTGLHLPDFRSGERTFSLLTQVAGRAGRRGPGSRVVVQSYSPDHYAIQAAARHDYEAFFSEEIDFRHQHRYPPFARLIRFLYRHRSDSACAKAADEMARKLAGHARQHGTPMDLLGPAPAFVSRIRGDYQWQVILRTSDIEPLLDGLPVDPGWVVDVDPQSLL